MQAAKVNTLEHGADQPFYHCLAAPISSHAAAGSDNGDLLCAPMMKELRQPRHGLRIYAAQENLRTIDHAAAAEDRKELRINAASAVMDLLVNAHQQLAAHFSSLDVAPDCLRFNRSELLEEMYPHDGAWEFERELLRRRVSAHARRDGDDSRSEIPLMRLATAASSGRSRLASLITLSSGTR